MSKNPDHQQFTVGPFTLYSHDYDGDILTLIKESARPEGKVEQVFVHETDLIPVLQKLLDGGPHMVDLGPAIVRVTEKKKLANR